MSEYSKLLAGSKEWQSFRKRCLDRAGHKCCRCGATEQTLQVHHPYYEEGLKPWEYDVDFCEVLCRTCHAAEHGLALPVTGWELIHSDYWHGEPTGDTYCDFCGSAMHWHNYVSHPKIGVLCVGIECASKRFLPGITEAKARMDKKQRFIKSPRWKRTAKGWRYAYSGAVAFVLDMGGGFKLNILGQWGSIKYRTMEQARAKAFDVLSEKGAI